MLLAGRARNVCAVGDDDQCIYSWRGAEVSNILELRPLLPRRRRRCGSSRTTARTPGDPRRGQRGHREEPRAQGQADVDRPQGRRAHPGGDRAHRGGGGALRRPRDPQARGRRASRRTRSRCSTAPTARPARSRRRCARSGIRYEVVGGSEFFDRREVKDVIAYFKVIANPQDEIIAAAHRQRAGARHRRRHHGAARRARASATASRSGRRWQRAERVRGPAPGRGREGGASSSR